MTLIYSLPTNANVASARARVAMKQMINFIRRLAKLSVDDGWLALAILGVVVFWMMHTA